jgi:preprotein translocase subunit SecA
MLTLENLTKFFRKVFGDKTTREMRRVAPIVQEINEWFEELKELTDEQLAAKTPEFRERLAQGETLNDLLPEAFAVAKEACRRHCGKEWEAAGVPIRWEMVPYDVQLAGGIFIHEGKIAEMATGEGKTLVAVCPVYLNALAGQGVHLVTVNDYLARRDSEWMGPIFQSLGLTIGCLDITESNTPERKAMYDCDITYGTNHEFGFDYLRDNMASEPSQIVQQRGHFFAIVDEVDNILIDEARTPLIISGAVDRSTHRYNELKPGVESLVQKQAKLLNQMVTEAEALLKTNPQSREAGIKLLAVQRGNPKHKRLTKLKGEPGISTLIEKVELDFIAEKRLFEVDETVYYVVDEKGHQIDLTEMGRTALTPDNPKLWEMPDFVEEIERVDSGNFDVIVLKDGQKVLHTGRAEERKAERMADGSFVIHRHNGLAKIPADMVAEIIPGTEVPKTERDTVVKEVVRLDHQAQSEKLHNISQLLRAYTLYERDKEYVVTPEGKVVIVDEFTGRLMTGRRWSDGLHQAVECKEGVEIEKETQTLATVTLQNYFRMYKKLAGMTGTAETEAGEFAHTYKIDTVVVPPNKPTQRQDLEDVIYKTRRAKFNAVINEVERFHKEGLPVLVGTVSVEASETLSRMLSARKIPHNVLNAKQHQREAEIVAQAGQPGMVTIATNMAGRGTDIKLHPEVAKNGGLQIIGTERHESRRIDRQLRGRAGRQGDPGTSRFFLSLEDDLMRMFGSERISRFMDRLGIQEDEPIESFIVTRAIESAQKKVETRNFEIRKRTLDYDNVMNRQREAIYGLRREFLLGDNIRDSILAVHYDAIRTAAEELLADLTPTNEFDRKVVTADDFLPLLEYVYRNIYQIPEVRDLAPELVGLDADEIATKIMPLVEKAYDLKSEELGDLEPGHPYIERIARFVAMSIIDREWMDHLRAVDDLRESVHFRGYAQLDPLVEYQKEASIQFDSLMLRVNRQILERFFLTQPVLHGQQPEQDVRVDHVEARQASLQETLPPPPPALEELPEELQQDASFLEGVIRGEEDLTHHTAPGQGRAATAQIKQQTVVRTGPKLKPNDPCWCGSGKKFKKCHGARS